MHADFVGSRKNTRKRRDEEDIEYNRMKIEIVMRKKWLLKNIKKINFQVIIHNLAKRGGGVAGRKR